MLLAVKREIVIPQHVVFPERITIDQTNLITRLRRELLEFAKAAEGLAEFISDHRIQFAIQKAIGVIDQQTLGNIHLGQRYTPVVDRLEHANGFTLIGLGELKHLKMADAQQPALDGFLSLVHLDGSDALANPLVGNQ
ncbi:hypothetical protein D3C87_1503390 [compost metagenome]